MRSLINNIKIENSCLVCERLSSNYVYICDHCHSLLDPVNLQLGRNFKFVDKAYSAFYYNEFMRRILYDFKFKNKRYYGKLFGELLTEKIFLLKFHKEIDFIVPVPLSKDSYKKRGFNQVELFSKYIVEKTELSLSLDNLIKVRESEEQARLDTVDRIHNLDSAFKLCNPDIFREKNILIIDDLITTGTTVDKCAETMKGIAKNIYALSITTIRQ